MNGPENKVEKEREECEELINARLHEIKNERHRGG